MNKQQTGTSLVVQGLGLCNSNAGGTGSIPGQGTKIPQATYSQMYTAKKRKKKKENQTNRHLSKVRKSQKGDE